MNPNPATSSFEEWQDHCAQYGVSILNSKMRMPTQSQLDFERKQRDAYKKSVADKEAAKRKRQEDMMNEFLLSLSK